MTNTAKTEVAKPAVVERKERVRRTPLDGARDILTVYDKDPNYVYRWVRNDEGRVEWFQERGYEVVQSPHKVGEKTVDSGTQLGSAIVKHGGGTTKLILMRILKEWYDQDQAAKERSIAATEASMQDANAQVGGSGGYGRLDINRRR